MNRLDRAMYALHAVDMQARSEGWIHRVHPLAKLVVTIIYITVVVSFHKMDLAGLLGMLIYPVIMITLGEISLGPAVELGKPLVVLLLLIGIANPFLDRSLAAQIGPLVVTGGMFSMATLMIKGVLAMGASFILISTTPMNRICGALARVGVPGIIVSVILLMNRYIVVLLEEAQRMSVSYSMRAPGQGGISYRAWGSFIGQLIFRTIDRAGRVYESMTLRGYDSHKNIVTPSRFRWRDGTYLLGWSLLIVLLRFFPLPEMVERILQ